MRFAVAAAAFAGAALALPGCARAPQGPELAYAYSQVAQIYRDERRFRKAWAPPDAPFDRATLQGNFLKIAFRTEMQRFGGVEIVQAKDLVLHRWERPVRYHLIGASDGDRAYLDGVISRIRTATGLDIAPAPQSEEPNILIAIVGGRERRDLVGLLTELEGPDATAFLRAWWIDPSYPCIGNLSSRNGDGRIERGLILIKAELQGDFRNACLTEEFTQTLGLMNDSFDVRPSIFNDDQEFIELTEHDLYLLRILYDRRLRPGMSRDEAAPIVREIVDSLPGLAPAPAATPAANTYWETRG